MIQVRQMVLISEVDKILGTMLSTQVPVKHMETDHIEAHWTDDGKVLMLRIEPYNKVEQ